MIRTWLCASHLGFDVIYVGYFLLGMISLCVMSAIRRAVPYDPVAQEKLVGGLLTALAIADVST